MANFMQKLVSKKKRRFQEDGFDLDMTFITKNVVAMGYPSEKLEGVFRNRMSDVKRFFDTRHTDHYKVYNLCSERSYDPAKFYHRVANYAFDDHNAPPFLLVEPFCQDVAAYLAEDERNVAVIHCKAGKGRTGVMICAFLLHNKMWTDTQDSLDFYGHARTKNGKGVTIPSQVRYVHYYGRYIREQLKYVARPLLLTKIIFKGLPTFSNGTCVPLFFIRQGANKEVVFKSKFYDNLTKESSDNELALDRPIPLCDDVKIEFIHRKPTGGKEKMFHMWFNTFFVENHILVIAKPEIDKANKDKKHKLYPASFAVEFRFEEMPAVAEGDNAAGATSATSLKPKLPHQDSTFSQAPDFSDSDLTTDDEDDDEGEFSGPTTDM